MCVCVCVWSVYTYSYSNVLEYFAEVEEKVNKDRTKWQYLHEEPHIGRFKITKRVVHAILHVM